MRSSRGSIKPEKSRKRGVFIFLRLPSPRFSTLLHNPTESKVRPLSSLDSSITHTIFSARSSSLHKAKHSVSRLAASALAPGTHLLPAPLRFPLPARQPPPCPGEKRGSRHPANLRGSGHIPLWRPAGVCHSNSRGQHLNQPLNPWREEQQGLLQPHKNVTWPSGPC